MSMASRPVSYPADLSWRTRQLANEQIGRHMVSIHGMSIRDQAIRESYKEVMGTPVDDWTPQTFLHSRGEVRADMLDARRPAAASNSLTGSGHHEDWLAIKFEHALKEARLESAQSRAKVRSLMREVAQLSQELDDTKAVLHSSQAMMSGGKVVKGRIMHDGNTQTTHSHSQDAQQWAEDSKLKDEVIALLKADLRAARLARGVSENELAAEVEAARDEIEALKSERHGFTSGLEQLGERLREKEAQEHVLRAEIKDVRDRAALEERLGARVSAELAALQKEFESVQKEQREAQGKLSRADEQAEVLKKDLDHERAERKMANEEAMVATRGLTNLRIKVRELEMQVEEYRQTAQADRKARREAEERRDALHKEVQEARIIAVSSKAELEQVQQLTARDSVTSDGVHKEYRATLVRLGAVQEEAARERASNDALTVRCADLETRLRVSEEALAQAQECIDDKDKRLDMAKGPLAALVEGLQGLCAELELRKVSESGESEEYSQVQALVWAIHRRIAEVKSFLAFDTEEDDVDTSQRAAENWIAFKNEVLLSREREVERDLDRRAIIALERQLAALERQMEIANETIVELQTELLHATNHALLAQEASRAPSRARSSGQADKNALVLARPQSWTDALLRPLSMAGGRAPVELELEAEALRQDVQMLGEACERHKQGAAWAQSQLDAARGQLRAELKVRTELEEALEAAREESERLGTIARGCASCSQMASAY